MGLDVHKKTIAVALAEPGRQEPRSKGEIANRPKSIQKLARRLSERFGGGVLQFVYEAGPCGYGLYHQLSGTGHACEVVAPSRIPKAPAKRIKTDRRDALRLTLLTHSGDLTPVWARHRAGSDAGSNPCSWRHEGPRAQGPPAAERFRAASRSRLARWQETLDPGPLHVAGVADVLARLAADKYVDAMKAAPRRVADLRTQMERALVQWSVVVQALVALRGSTRWPSWGDISRFDSPRQLVALLGLVPSEHSNGGMRRHGGITLTGNGHARRMLVESPWSYRFPARQTKHLKRKATPASVAAKGIAWQTQKQLFSRYRDLIQAGKNSKLVCVAIARKLAASIRPGK